MKKDKGVTDDYHLYKPHLADILVNHFTTQLVQANCARVALEQ